MRFMKSRYRVTVERMLDDDASAVAQEAGQ